MNSDQLTSHAISPARVFYVEDEEDIRENMSYLLAQRGFEVLPCASAEVFYKTFARQPEGVVVLDIGLPGEDGLSICRYMREHRPDLGIVFVTARDQKDDRLEGLQSGGDAYLTKPFDTDELVAIINRLHGVHARAQAQRSVPLQRAALAALEAHAPEAGILMPQTQNWMDPAHKDLLDKQIQMAGEGFAWTYEPDSGLLRGPNNGIRRFSGNERTVMNVLAKAGDAPLDIHALAEALGLPDDDARKKRVEVIISRMRRNVLESVGLPLPLLLFRGLGYKLHSMKLA